MKKTKLLLFLLIILGLVWGGKTVIGQLGAGGKAQVVSLTKGLVGHWSLDEEQETHGVDLVDGWDFTTWPGVGNGEYVDADTFQTTAGGAGGIQKAVGIVIGKRYRVRVAGTIVSGVSSYRLFGQGGTPTIITPQSGTFDVTVDFTGASGSALYQYLTGAIAVCDITAFEVFELQTGDATPYQNKGTLYQDDTIYTTDQKGVANGAMEFNGDDDKIDTGSDIIGTGADSISAWIYLNSYGDFNLGNIIDNGIFKFIVDGTDAGPTNAIRLDSSGGFSTSANSIDGSILTGQWYHIVGTRDASGIANIYVDGVLSGSADQVSGTPAGGGNVIIGNNTGQTRGFDGSISDVRIYDRALSTAEITELYNLY